MAVAELTEQCPTCGASIPIDRRYPSWCEHCNWNLHPHTPAQSGNLVPTLYARLGKRLGRELFAEVQRLGARNPAVTGARMLAFVIALSVLLAAAGCALGGLLLFRSDLVVGPLLGVVLFGMAISARPRVGRPPRQYASRESFPALYTAADAVAGAMRTPRVDRIVLNTDYNASFARLGLRRKRVLTLGIPLLLALDRQERVALMAHELAHDCNGDPNRSFLAATALRTLDSWCRMLRPMTTLNGRYNGLALVEYFAGVLLWLLSYIPRAWATLLVHALWQDSQRSEYYADALAAGVSGTQGMLGLLDKLHLAHVLAGAVQTAAVSQVSFDACVECARRIEELPDRERERLRRVARLQESQLDSTHPPTAFRIESLLALSAHEQAPLSPLFTLGAAENAAITGEVCAVSAAASTLLVEKYRRRLYY